MNNFPSFFGGGRGVVNLRSSITVGAVPWPADSEALRLGGRSPAHSLLAYSRCADREGFYAGQANQELGFGDERLHLHCERFRDC